jgi:hypothetical protein
MPRLAEVVIVLPKQSDKGEERRERDAAQPAFAIVAGSRAAGIILISGIQKATVDGVA